MAESKLIRNLPQEDQTPRSKVIEPKKKEREPLKPVIKGDVIIKKPSVFKRISESLFGEGLKSAGSYILHDVLRPAIQDLIVDTITEGAHKAIYGMNNPMPRRRGRRTNQYGTQGYSTQTPYHASYNQPSRTYQQEPVMRNGLQSLSFTDKIDAEEVLMAMFERLEGYDFVSVLDYYELCKAPHNYTDDKFGWDDLSDASVVRVYDGYMIKLPRPKPYV